MMTTAPVSSATTTATVATTSSARTKTVDFQAFLTLLIAQLKNQDPTKPMDSTQFVSQLASFSAVEQQVASNTKLDQLLASNNLSQAGSIVGLHLKSADGTVEGNIKEVRVLANSVSAVLDSGQIIDVASGITLSKA